MNAERLQRICLNEKRPRIPFEMRGRKVILF
jgi:hypothetical protein